MIIKENFDKEIQKICFIYTKSYEYYNCLKQINNFEKSEFNDTRFIRFFNYTCWYVLVIELSKIYQNDNNNQHYNIYKLLNVLRNNYKRLEYKNLISKETIERYYNGFNSPQITDIRDRLVILRNKFFAHTDRHVDEFIEKIEINLNEIEILFRILKQFIFDISDNVFLRNVEIDDESIFVNIERVLKNIQESRKKFQETNLEKMKEDLKKMNE